MTVIPEKLEVDGALILPYDYKSAIGGPDSVLVYLVLVPNSPKTSSPHLHAVNIVVQ